MHETFSRAKEQVSIRDERHEFKELLCGILADNEVDYKEAYELLYWLEDHKQTTEQFPELLLAIRQVLEDDELDRIEAALLKRLLNSIDRELI